MLNAGIKQCVTYIAGFGFHNFQNVLYAHKYLTWPLSDVIVGMKGNMEVTQKKALLPNVCVPILATQYILKQ